MTSAPPDLELAGEVRRAVTAHLETHEVASAKELECMLAECIAGYQAEPGRMALHQQLARLIASGHAHRVMVRGRPCWKRGPGPLAGRIATARRVLRLDTSVYEPCIATVIRPGAMDFARIPSLLLGHRTSYWGTSQ
jgi:hypothetical protein